MKTFALIAVITWSGLWFTPDQQGQRHFQRGEFAEAAEVFHDPLWQGASWYRAGEFEQAARSFARRDSAQAHYNEGNARLMLGKYEAAIACYKFALKQRPGWKEAAENLALAQARGKQAEEKAGNLGDQRLGADMIVFDKKSKNSGQETEVAGGKTLSQQEIQALWLRRVSTRPADFLKAKFAYQEAAQAQEAGQ